jgi:two-component system nitrate/nitrite sensor histidine kinase NarX
MDDRDLLWARWATFVALVLVLGFYLYMQAPWALWISILIATATAGLLTAVLEFWLRLSLRRAARQERSGTSRQQLHAALELQRKFLDAHSEKDILDGVLENGLAVLRASGASFIPLDEWGQSLPAIIQGQVPATALQNWARRLTMPETRQACKNCTSMHGGRGCILIPVDAKFSAHVDCFALQSNGRDVGVVNFYFDVETIIEPDMRLYLNEILRLAGQALDSLQKRNQEIGALLYLQTAATPRSELSTLLKSLLENIRKTLAVDFALLYIPAGLPGVLQTSPQVFTSRTDATQSTASIPDELFLDGIWKSVLSTGHSLSLENVSLNKREVWKTLHAVPLVWQDQGPEGVLLLGSNSGQAFAQRHQALLETLAGQAALLIQNSRLMVQLEYQAVVDERARLAREIHDGLAQTLAFLKIQAAQMQNYLSRGETERLTSTLQASYRTLSDAYIDARQAIENLRRIPSAGLGDWVRQVAADYEQSTSQKVVLDEFNLAVEYPPNVQAQLIRIIQEALSNVRKHAGAQNVSIRGIQKSDSVLIEVCDDGRGFAPEQVDGSLRFGLRGMHERAESIGADFQIASQPGAGTILSLRLPVPVKENP